jgi:hypothetical protein
MQKANGKNTGRARHGAALGLAVVLAAVLSTMRPSPAAAGTVVSSAIIPLSGDVTVGGGADTVTLTGVLHVVTQVKAAAVGTSATIHANLPATDVEAVGSGGTTYLAHGAGPAVGPPAPPAVTIQPILLCLELILPELPSPP